MSRMELYTVDKDGDVHGWHELHNSWLGSALVWTKLHTKYFGEFNVMEECRRHERLRAQGKDPGPFDHGGWQKSWSLQHSPRVTDAEWLVLMMTFDGCIVQRETFAAAASACEAFGKEHGGHFTELATLLRELESKEDVIGFCINATSVNQSPWWVYDDRDSDEADDGRCYNINKDTKHWFLDPSARAALIEKNKDNAPVIHGNP